MLLHGPWLFQCARLEVPSWKPLMTYKGLLSWRDTDTSIAGYGWTAYDTFWGSGPNPLGGTSHINPPCAANVPQVFGQKCCIGQLHVSFLRNLGPRTCPCPMLISFQELFIQGWFTTKFPWIRSVSQDLPVFVVFDASCPRGGGVQPIGATSHRFAGCIQSFEPSGLHRQNEEPIKRYGGTTAPEAPWPEEKQKHGAMVEDLKRGGKAWPGGW